MNIRKSATAVAVATTTMGIALAGAAVLAPAHAAPRTALDRRATDYGFQSTGYGTRIESGAPGVESGSTAFVYLSCTRLAGRHAEQQEAEISLPADDPYIHVEGLDSGTRTYRAKADGIEAAITSTNQVARVQLGNTASPRLIIEGLQTRSTAWATPDGTLETSNEITSGGISIEGTQGPGTGTPLDDLIDATNDGIQQVIAALKENGTTTIPGLGEVSFGFDRQVVKRRFAAASSKVLIVDLYGPDQNPGGGDDSTVTIGRSWTRINRDLPAGVMHGVAYGANAKLAGGVVKVGRQGEQPLPCNGTEGEIYESAIADVDPGSTGQLVATGLQGRSFGEKSASGGSRAWTMGSVASFRLGSLELRSIVGRVNVKQNAAGKIVRNNIKGSSVGEVIVDGESQGAFGPGEAGQIPADGIPGVAKIEFFAKEKSKRGMKVAAVVITMLPDTPGVGVIKLGVAQAHLNRY